jgi:hypothetical protein
MPSAPPPTPSQNGAPLPTTMSAGLKNKSKLIHHRGPLLPSTLPPINTSNAAPKKKAKFFIKEYEADDDNKTFSPTSFPVQPAVAHIAREHRFKYLYIYSFFPFIFLLNQVHLFLQKVSLEQPCNPIKIPHQSYLMRLGQQRNKHRKRWFK